MSKIWHFPPRLNVAVLDLRLDITTLGIELLHKKRVLGEHRGELALILERDQHAVTGSSKLNRLVLLERPVLAGKVVGEAADKLDSLVKDEVAPEIHGRSGVRRATGGNDIVLVEAGVGDGNHAVVVAVRMSILVILHHHLNCSFVAIAVICLLNAICDFFIIFSARIGLYTNF